ncbi:MAG: sugar phosphate isomerase/epimerase family protein [Massiliimalia sp.]|jgi:sugar phosphate isomerase/epimerase
MEYGLQLYSVRDVTETDWENTLKQVAQMGYTYVEPAGFFGHSAEEVKEVLDRYGLKVSGAHVNWKEIAENFEETVAFHKTIGNKNLIIPGADLDTKEKVADFLELIHNLQPRLEQEGMVLQYHNHDFEFKPNKDGQIFYDLLTENTSIPLEIDTYWVYAAGKDPLALMEQLKDRVSVIHIKDGNDKGDGYPLGMGTAPVKEVWAKAKELGMLMVVESETLTPSGLEEAKICIDFLKQIEG